MNPACASIFFEQERGQFFRPLTSKYRAQIVECLRELYQRLYSSSSADYGQAIQRDVVIEIFQEALVRAPILADDVLHDDQGSSVLYEEQSSKEDVIKTNGQANVQESRFRNTREQAGWVLNTLIEHGWLEKQVDEASLQSTFAFTRHGREFTSPFIQTPGSARTRHRNTRNTRNALESFLERQDIYDLLDAYEYSERIISDFTDVIAELEERKRDLVREMEDQILLQRASDAFFDFMENRFQPDLSVRLSADNVEKHRDQIQQLIEKIRKMDVDVKATAERRLREIMPELIQPGQSILWHLLDAIDLRLRNASDVMLPALRRALQSFTKRADIIMRQMSYLASQQHNDVLSVCKKLADMPAKQQDSLLEKIGNKMAVPEISFIDPAQVRVHTARQRQTIDSQMDDEQGDFDTDARKEIYVQQVLDQAFLINQHALRQFMVKQLASGKQVSTRDISIENAQDFLAVAHAIGLGAADGLSSEFSFQIEYDTREQTAKADEYFDKKDHFTFEMVQK